MGEQGAVILRGEGLASVGTERDHVVGELDGGAEGEAKRREGGEHREAARRGGEEGRPRALVVAAKPEGVVEGAEAEAEGACAGLLHGPELGAPFGQPAVAVAGRDDPGREAEQRAGHGFSMESAWRAAGSARGRRRGRPVPSRVTL